MTRLSDTEMRRLAHRVAAGALKGDLEAGWEVENYLPGEEEPYSPQALRLMNAIQAIIDKLCVIGDR